MKTKNFSPMWLELFFAHSLTIFLLIVKFTHLHICTSCTFAHAATNSSFSDFIKNSNSHFLSTHDWVKIINSLYENWGLVANLIWTLFLHIFSIYALFLTYCTIRRGLSVLSIFIQFRKQKSEKYHLFLIILAKRLFLWWNKVGASDVLFYC